MVKYEVVVLAFHRIREPEFSQLSLSAVVTIHGKPVIEWVIDALRASSRTGTITVVGPEELESLLCMRFTERRISSLAAAFDYFLRVSQTATTQSVSKNRFIIIPCEAVFISAPVIDRIINTFESNHPDIAVPYLNVERLSRYPSQIKSATRHEGRNVVPGVFAIAKNIHYVPAAFRKLNELHKERDLFRDSGFIIPIVSAIEEQVVNRTDIRFEYIESHDTASAMLIQNTDDIDLGSRILPKPFLPKFSKVKIILNPKSGSTQKRPKILNSMVGMPSRMLDTNLTAETHKDRIIYYLREMGISAETVQASSADHASSLARECALSGYDLVIAVGGDGTINSVINGIVNTNTALGVIPFGTVNVFALLMDIPLEIRAACQVIARGKTRTIDLGKANNRYFSSLTGIGFDAYIIHMMDSGFKRTFGAGAYFFSGLMNLLHYRFKTIHLTIDNQPVKRTGYVVVIGNGKYYSPNMVISPAAKIDDGMLDIVIFKSHNLFRVASYLWQMKAGNLAELPDVEYLQGKHIVVEQHGNHFVHIDGEPYGHTPIDIEVVPSSLKVVC